LGGFFKLINSLLLNNFYNKYPFILFDELIDYFSIFGGVEEYFTFDLLLNIEDAIKNNLEKIEIEDILPFFVLEKPFREFLIKVARSDGKLNSNLSKASIGETFGEELIRELESAKIIRVEKSREKDIKLHPKQKIKKEYKHYTIQSKIFFTKPFFKFWFAFVEPYRDKSGNIDINLVINDYKSKKYTLSSLVFEHLSLELLKRYFQNRYNFFECASYWDRFSEFDIYCKAKDISIIGECKYTNRPITKAELIKLENKIKQSNLKADCLAFFSKSGYSHELLKLSQDNLLLFHLEDFKLLIK